MCYINLDNGVETVKDFYNNDHKEGGFVNYNDEDFTKHFYKIPEDKRNVKVLHGEKLTTEMKKITYFLKELEYNGYFEKN